MKHDCSPNLSAFLDMIAESEIGSALLMKSADGYNVLVGSTPTRPLLFASYASHPNILNHATNSTAAGRYQLLHRYYEAYRKQLCLVDFTPHSQDAIAIQQIKECHAIPLIESGKITEAIAACAHIWASLPGAGYGQHENKLAVLEAAYRNAGGVCEVTA